MRKVSKEWKQDLLSLLNDFGLEVNNSALYFQAFVHSSYANEVLNDISQDNERLEFLGDGVLGLFVTESLFLKFKNKDEGILSRMKAMLVSEFNLSKKAQQLGIENFILHGNGLEISRIKENPRILCSVFEALVGCIYLDSGHRRCFEFCNSIFEKDFESLLDQDNHFLDYKTKLQELLQSENGETPKYRLINEWGPEHRKTFEVEAYVSNEILGKGDGDSKKQAERMAARRALEKRKV